MLKYLILTTFTSLTLKTSAFSDGAPKNCWHCRQMRTGHGGQNNTFTTFPLKYNPGNPNQPHFDNKFIRKNGKPFHVDNKSGKSIYHFAFNSQDNDYFKGISIQFRSEPNDLNKYGVPIGEFVDIDQNYFQYVDCRDCYPANRNSNFMSEKSCITRRVVRRCLFAAV